MQSQRIGAAFGNPSGTGLRYARFGTGGRLSP